MADDRRFDRWSCPCADAGVPPDDIQADFVGSSNETALREAWNFYLLMADTRRRYGVELGRNTNVLDFGCGWGRFARMFFRDVPPGNLWCADSWDLALDTCRQTGVPGHLVKVDQLPPASLPSDHFDTAFAYSVFSHLSPAAHRAWEAEFARMVRSGGPGICHHPGRLVLRQLPFTTRASRVRHIGMAPEPGQVVRRPRRSRCAGTKPANSSIPPPVVVPR